MCNSESLLIKMLDWLKTIEMNILIVLDNVEDLLYNDKKAFRTLVNELLISCSTLHILTTSRTTLGTL
jgi:predicted ATPase